MSYIHDSVRIPSKDVVENFPDGIMPPFGEMLSEEEEKALVKYLKGV